MTLKFRTVQLGVCESVPVHGTNDKFQFTSNENPIVYTSDLIVINSHDESQCKWNGEHRRKKDKLSLYSVGIAGKGGALA